MSEGIKHDQGKAPIGLVSAIALEGLARVLEMGAVKYGKHNWRKGLHWQRVIDAAFRHLNSFNAGIDLDDESGLNHLDHAMCCLMFLREYYALHPELDDRYKGEK